MKHILKICIIAAIVLAVSVGLWFYLNGYLARSKASAETAQVSFSQTHVQAHEGDEVRVDLTLSTASTTNTNLGISGVDLSFITTGSNLDFLYAKSTAVLPVGFDNRVLDEAHSTAGVAPKRVTRMIFVAQKPSQVLQKSIIIPLYFKVLASGQPTISTKIEVNTTASQVVGPLNRQYPVVTNPTAASFTVDLTNPLAAAVTNLVCDTIRNTSHANCGKGVAFTWTDSVNESQYRIYKNSQLIKTVGKNTITYNDPGCPNYDPNTYSIVAFNAMGESAAVSVSCACQVCPTDAPPTPTPIQPLSSSDLIFRVVFPDALQTVNEIPNVKVTILDNDGNHICDDNLDCEKVVTFHRVPGARVPNTFISPQLQYSLQRNQAYTVLVKQNHTVRQSYKYVYLKWQKVLQCKEGSSDTGCGQLLQEVVTRPLFSGDLDGSNSVDQADADRVSVGVGANSAEGDLNFDGITDKADVEILGKNFSKKGT